MNADRILKLLISCLFFAWQTVRDGVCRLLGLPTPPRCIVLYYHSIPDTYRDGFAKQLDTILQSGEPVHPNSLEKLKPRRRYCLVTFDDGFSNFKTNAFPELSQRGIPSLMFVITGALGKSFGPPQAPEQVMTAEDLRQFPESLVVLGSHTVRHPFLPDLSEAEASLELEKSRSQLEVAVGRPIRYFSFPFGAMTPELVSLCKRAGFERVYSTLPCFTTFDANEYCVGRIRVDPWDHPLEFRLKLAGAYNWLPSAISLKRKLRSNRIGSLLFAGQSSENLSPHRSLICD